MNRFTFAFRVHASLIGRWAVWPLSEPGQSLPMIPDKSGLVLVIEDERNIAGLLGDYLDSEGFDVDFAVDGVEGLRLATENGYDAIVLDGALPRMDGLVVCREIRDHDHGRMPILMVTARDTLEDKIAGLEAGADDYLTKPFSPAELVARLRSMIRRARQEVSQTQLVVADLEADPAQMTVRRAGKPVRVTPVGWKILTILMRESPRVVPRKELEREIWGAETPDSDSLRSHMYLLRKAVDRGHDVPLMHTMPSVGYSISVREGTAPVADITP